MMQKTSQADYFRENWLNDPLLPDDPILPLPIAIGIPVK